MIIEETTKNGIVDIIRRILNIYKDDNMMNIVIKEIEKLQAQNNIIDENKQYLKELIFRIQ